MTSRRAAVVLLSMLLAGFLLLSALPNRVASVRLGGLSLIWWYGGVVAPVAGGFVAFRGLAAPPSRSSADARRSADP